MQRLLEGHARFRAEVFPKHASLFNHLATGQKPQALFLTCADSRVVPDMILQSNPGDLFICRNAGNIVPSYGEATGGVSATIEYAVLALGIENIIVCGHSDCGAMKAVLSGKKHDNMPTVDAWLKHSTSAMQMLEQHEAHELHDAEEENDPQARLRGLTRANVIAQLANLQTHPSVAAALARGKMNLYGWVYEIHSGRIQSYDAQQGRFLPLSAETPTSVNQPRLHLMAS
ncbi:carbonic anhydrase [Granulicella pectinivorans]|jgi:carbonic anhydrase|uniref:Carbonic anhydrase n=1 Tax=Granulicella pectinivorans TaxID=474950 RepID=A0A1I6MY29_9BACT|nr:carbonic anhydrase [Granulicella pectinivorans]SFS20605.1 carbonic anhydrase [Granulicella pectinivorans]